MIVLLLYKARSIYDNKPVIFHPDMVKIMQIDPKTDNVMTTVTLTFDLERSKTIQHFFMVTCAYLLGLVVI